MTRLLFRASLALALLLVVLAAIAGAFHLHVWQQNPAPQVESARWASSEGRLGSTSHLELDVRIPWHRHLIDPIKPAAPATSSLAKTRPSSRASGLPSVGAATGSPSR